MRVGYACICLGCGGLRCDRSTVLRRATPERLRDLIGQNIAGLRAILRRNEARGFRLFRIGNAFIPFASHPVNGIAWWEEFGPELRDVGRWAAERGHRLSFHASHYTVLNSTNPAVATAAAADLQYAARALDAMGLGLEHRVIVHGGSGIPSPAAAEARFEQAFAGLPAAVQARLTIENDERVFDAARATALAVRCGLPAVPDVLHHDCLPGRWAGMDRAELLERFFSTWRPEHGPPKVHFSSWDREKRAGSHAYGIDPHELELFLAQTRGVGRDFDLMFEAKGKDLAVEAVLPVLRRDPRYGGRDMAA